MQAVGPAVAPAQQLGSGSADGDLRALARRSQGGGLGNGRDFLDCSSSRPECWKRYVRHELLGQGAQKKVYKAFDEEDGMEVAWNVVPMGELAFANDKDRKRCFDEILVLNQLKHKNIMSLQDWWYDKQDGTLNFITELFCSGCLRQYRRKHRHVDLNVIKRWSWQILQGLVYLHGHNPPIIHRDLKCDNIFVNGSDGVLKIGDLGFATLQRGMCQAMTVVGTPEFMAPELYEETYNEKVDVYSFGMCVLELATLEYPYAECRNAAQIYKKVSQGLPPQGLEKVRQPELRDFIQLCLRHDHTERPESRQLLKHPFFDAIRPGGMAPGNVGGPLLPSGGSNGTGSALASPAASVIMAPRSTGSAGMDLLHAAQQQQQQQQQHLSVPGEPAARISAPAGTWPLSGVGSGSPPQPPHRASAGGSPLAPSAQSQSRSSFGGDVPPSLSPASGSSLVLQPGGPLQQHRLSGPGFGQAGLGLGLGLGLGGSIAGALAAAATATAMPAAALREMLHAVHAETAGAQNGGGGDGSRLASSQGSDAGAGEAGQSPPTAPASAASCGSAFPGQPRALTSPFGGQAGSADGSMAASGSPGRSGPASPSCQWSIGLHVSGSANSSSGALCEAPGTALSLQVIDEEHEMAEDELLFGGNSLPPWAETDADGDDPSAENLAAGLGGGGSAASSLGGISGGSQGQGSAPVNLAVRKSSSPFDMALSFAMSFTSHMGVRKKVGFKYDPSEDTASALAQEMVENLSLNASEAEAIAAMIQHEVNRVQHKQQQAAAAGSGAGAEEPGQEGGAGQAQEEGGGGGALAAIAAITAAAAAASAVAAEEEEADKAAAAAAAAQVVVAAPARADLPVPPRQ